MAAKSSFWMIGSSIPWGRSPRMALILARASWEASLILTSRLNSTTTLETLSREVEMTCLTPEMGLTASSIRLVTSRSTVSGEAPGKFGDDGEHRDFHVRDTCRWPAGGRRRSPG